METQLCAESDEISDFSSAREDVLVNAFHCYGFPMKSLQTGIACCFMRPQCLILYPTLPPEQDSL